MRSPILSTICVLFLKTMRTPSTVLYLAFLTASSQAYTLRQPDASITGKGFSDNQNILGNIIMNPGLLTNKAVLNTVSTMTDVRYGPLKHLRNIDPQVLTTLLDVYLEQLNAIKNAKVAFLNVLATSIQILIDQIEKHDFADLLNSPIFDLLLDVLLPLVSENSEPIVEDATDSKDEFSSGKIDIDDASLRENTEMPVTDEETTEKPSSMEIDPIIEEPVLTPFSQSSVRRLLKPKKLL